MSLTDTTRIQLFKTILNIHHGDFDRVKEFPAGRLPLLSSKMEQNVNLPFFLSETFGETIFSLNFIVFQN